jgi:hypothetical protein
MQSYWLLNIKGHMLTTMFWRVYQEQLYVNIKHTDNRRFFPQNSAWKGLHVYIQQQTNYIRNFSDSYQQSVTREGF